MTEKNNNLPWAERYTAVALPALKESSKQTNVWALPRVMKVVVNAGVGKSITDHKILEVAQETLQRITGQKPIVTKARTSISAFKIREGMSIGVKATLRGKRMEDFLDKLVRVTLPRIRDFRGLSASMLDAQGNLNIGFKEHVAFPEIRFDEVEKVHGIEVTIVTNAKSRDDALVLFTRMGFPFQS